MSRRKFKLSSASISRDAYHAIAYTDEDGIARFTIPPEALSEGEIMLTITKHNVLPYLTELEINAEADYLGISEFEIDLY